MTQISFFITSVFIGSNIIVTIIIIILHWALVLFNNLKPPKCFRMALINEMIFHHNFFIYAGRITEKFGEVQCLKEWGKIQHSLNQKQWKCSAERIFPPSQDINVLSNFSFGKKFFKFDCTLFIDGHCIVIKIGFLL